MSTAANTNDQLHTPASPLPAPVADGTARTKTPPAPVPAVSPSVATTEAPVQKKRRPGRFVLMLAVPLILAAGGTYVWVTGGRYQETENANLKQARVTISSEISGRVVKANVAENQHVRAGDILFAVDPELYRIALAQAEADLATARLKVEQLRSTYSQAMSKQKVMASDSEYYKAELDRQQTLTQKGVGTQSALDSARRDLVNAQDELAAASEAVTGALAGLGGDPSIPTDSHPLVLAALAARDKAAFDLTQTTVTAPADGVISQAESFKTGEFVNAGTPVFSLVETGDTWVEANFKETQLTHMKRGQKAEITLDTFPDRPLIATVDTIGAGTGAEFSLLPAQNATGNWVKVTQRVPVRLKLDSDHAGLLMRTGLSATVTVDTGVTRHLGDLLGDLKAHL